MVDKLFVRRNDDKSDQKEQGVESERPFEGNGAARTENSWGNEEQRRYHQGIIGIKGNFAGPNGDTCDCD